MLKRNRKAKQPTDTAAAEDRFSADAFAARIEAMVDEGRGEEALDLFLSQLGPLAQSPLHRREKLNHLRFLGRLIEGSTASKHGPDKLFRKTRMIGRYMEQLGATPVGTFLDFGCGRHDPLALATVAFANGFERTIACDLDPVANASYSALSMYDILLELNRLPQRFLLPGGDKKSFRNRIKAIAPRPFAKREFDRGCAAMAGQVDYRIAELTSLDISDGELGLAVSFAVLEHVTDAPTIYEWLFRKTRPGCGQIHYIDLADHRAYRDSGSYDKWSFLTEEVGPPTLNRLRAHEHLEMAARAGFEIAQEERVSADMPRETSERLRDPWRELPKEELETIGLRMLLRRPE